MSGENAKPSGFDVRTYFGADYRESVERVVGAERTSAEIDFLLATTGVRAPARVLDLGCGHGRHAIELARRGVDVTGVDLNTGALALARAAAGDALPVRFVERDYATPPDGAFDIVMSLFGSFGYGSDDANERTLRAWCDRVASGGWLVLELWHRDLIVTAFEPRRTWRAGDALEVDERRAFDPLSGRLEVHYTYAYDDGRRTEHDIDVRLYTAAELRAIVERGGLAVRALHGSMRGDAYGATSRYLVMVAQRA